jgi:CubicO group peptidase (beta-lactamase class C family)
MAESGLSSQRLKRIDPAMRLYTDSQKIAGIQTLLYRHGQIVHEGWYGWMDVSSSRPMQPDALFRIYSMTKPVTCTAVLVLWEQGFFRLTDPVSSYIPAFKDLRVYSTQTGAGLNLLPLARPLTIHDLLTHTSGLAYGLEPSTPVDILYQQQRMLRTDETLADKIYRLIKLPLLHQPGERFTYSIATDVLGYLVEVVSGKPFDIFLQEYIFEPLGMSDTDFYVPPQKIERLSAIYYAGPGGQLIDLRIPPESNLRSQLNLPEYISGEWIFKERQPMFCSGGGGLVSTARDYLRFARMLLGKGEVDGERILGRKTVEFMLLNHLPEKMDTPGIGLGYGLGILLDPARAMMMGSVGSFGGGGAAGTDFWVDPQENMIGILMIQLIPGSQYPIAQDFKTLACQAIID